MDFIKVDFGSRNRKGDSLESQLLWSKAERGSRFFLRLENYCFLFPGLYKKKPLIEPLILATEHLLFISSSRAISMDHSNLYAKKSEMFVPEQGPAMDLENNLYQTFNTILTSYENI